ncbi:MAG: tetratricopeptide repeat protein, partial [Candidatus Omnitrophica bacterium]|nr:tetratricopeptide repeat protein [Candidatus Omnitrophota bacterium]
DSNARIQHEIASCREAEGKMDEALDGYMKVIYKFPDSKYWVAEARLKSAGIFEDRNEWLKAKKMYEKLLELDTRHTNEVLLKLEEIRKKVKGG